MSIHVPKYTRMNQIVCPGLQDQKVLLENGKASCDFDGFVLSHCPCAVYVT